MRNRKKDSDKTSSSPTSPSIPASTVTTPTGGGTGTTLSQSGTGGTASTGQTAKPTGGTISSSNKADTEKDPSAVSPVATEETEDNPFTPDGSATVVDNASDEQGKEFYTIMTPDENVFYLIIDKQRDSENVYFLNAVTESDLMALAQKRHGQPDCHTDRTVRAGTRRSCRAGGTVRTGNIGTRTGAARPQE